LHGVVFDILVGSEHFSMVPPDAHSHDHGHAHAHSHGPASPHPAQAAPWSILRMTVVSRLAAALAVSAGLWAVVWVAMR
jgi:rhodanese-related sulfurtransferase